MKKKKMKVRKNKNGLIIWLFAATDNFRKGIKAANFLEESTPYYIKAMDGLTDGVSGLFFPDYIIKILNRKDPEKRKEYPASGNAAVINETTVFFRKIFPAVPAPAKLKIGISTDNPGKNSVFLLMQCPCQAG